MIPKTNIEKQLTALSSSLAPIKTEVCSWAEKNIFLNWGVLSRGKFYCLECAHSWKPSDSASCSKFTNCSNCKAKLKMQACNQMHFKEIEYFSVSETCADYQVVRIVIAYKHMKKNFTPTYFCKEVMQHWISQKAEVRSFSIGTNVFSSTIDAWKFYSALEIRPKDFFRNAKFYINPYKVYPQIKIMPVLKRNGFKTSVYEIATHLLFSALLTYPIAETLLKAKQLNVLQYYLGASRQCVKHNSRKSQRSA